ACLSCEARRTPRRRSQNDERGASRAGFGVGAARPTLSVSLELCDLKAQTLSLRLSYSAVSSAGKEFSASSGLSLRSLRLKAFQYTTSLRTSRRFLKPAFGNRNIRIRTF